MQAIYWITAVDNGRLGTMARPRGGDWLAGDLAALRQVGVDTLVTLLNNAERDELELAELPINCQRSGIEWVTLPIPDFDVPPLNAATAAFVAGIAERLRAGQQVVVHCRQGIGRSSLIAASTLVLLGSPPAPGVCTDPGCARPACARHRGPAQLGRALCGDVSLAARA